MRAETTSRRERISFGDFQTPRSLADDVCRLLCQRGLSPQAIVEPTCGVGNFLLAAADAFPGAKRIVGVEINDSHLAVAAAAVGPRCDADRYRLIRSSFFDVDWPSELTELPEPILVIGNPPWVTNATQGALGSGNLPVKSNLYQQRGIDAITGKANFDISEWMLLKMFDWLNGRTATLAMLCKTAVARRVLTYTWQHQLGLRAAELHSIDAQTAFGAAVEACLLVAEFSPGAECDSASVFPFRKSLDECKSTGRIGWRDGWLIANLEHFARWKHLCTEAADAGADSSREARPMWRSGVKHDCADVMELVERDDRMWNKLGEEVDLEPECLYPLLKSGDLAARGIERPRRWLVLPQQFVGDDTGRLEQTAPRTWQYLMSHAARLDARRSSIYRRQSRFAVFGVGEYTFAPWKVAVSGLAKQPRFAVIGSMDGRPIVLDDASYFLPCSTQREAARSAELLNSSAARDFLSAFVFWDAKRPVTAEVLRRLDLNRLASDSHLPERVDRTADESGKGRMR